MFKSFKMSLVVVLSLCMLVPMDMRAAQVVTSDELHQDLLNSWNEKEANLATVQQLLSTDAARELIQNTGNDYKQVMQALPLLDDEELSKLANQTRVAQANFAAGLSDRELINVLLIVLLVVAIIVVVAAVAD
jgi:hypothetical protein